jgi:hypothetical protein
MEKFFQRSLATLHSEWLACKVNWSRMCLQQRSNDHGHATPHTDFLLRDGSQTTLGKWLVGTRQHECNIMLSEHFHLRTAPVWKTSVSTHVFKSVITLFNAKLYFFIRFPHVNNKFMRCHITRHWDLAKEPKDMVCWESIRPSSVRSHYNAHFHIRITQTDKYADVHTDYLSHSNTQTA